MLSPTQVLMSSPSYDAIQGYQTMMNGVIEGILKKNYKFSQSQLNELSKHVDVFTYRHPYLLLSLSTAASNASNIHVLDYVESIGNVDFKEMSKHASDPIFARYLYSRGENKRIGSNFAILEEKYKVCETELSESKLFNFNTNEALSSAMTELENERDMNKTLQDYINTYVGGMKTEMSVMRSQIFTLKRRLTESQEGKRVLKKVVGKLNEEINGLKADNKKLTTDHQDVLIDVESELEGVSLEVSNTKLKNMLANAIRQADKLYDCIREREATIRLLDGTNHKRIKRS